MATFDLTFHIPQKMQIVAVGNEISSSVVGNERVAVWKAATPLRVAGFNYGKFKKLSTSDKESGMTVDVYTNPGTPDIIREINQYLEAASANRANGEIGDGYIGPGFVKVDTGSLAQSAMADGINTARTAKAFFGMVPSDRVSITQQSQWSFGQSWPQLIYLPYIAFLDGMTRNTLGLTGAKDFIDVVGPHEFAHQWWGHAVSPKTYHDEWISEGFAEFTAGLVLQQTGGWPQYNTFWERKRKYIMERSRGAMLTNDQAGPISAGFRLVTWQTPEAYDAIVYAKGAYVLHMLRMTMQDRSKKNPDEPFMEMMTDFAKSYSGKNVTTADFQHVVERHMTPSLKLTADGKADWFFQQWVYGTTIPRLTQKLDVADAGNGKYRISGTISQSDVPDNFVVVVPIYVYFDKNAWARLGALTIVGNKSQDVNIELALPRKPAKIVANAMHDVLTK
jgi:aminopeptidase N